MANITTIIDCPGEGMTLAFISVTVTGNSLQSFVVQGRAEITDPFLDIAGAAEDYLEPKGAILNASGDLTSLGAGLSGWVLVDATGYESLRIVASAEGGAELVGHLLRNGPELPPEKKDFVLWAEPEPIPPEPPEPLPEGLPDFYAAYQYDSRACLRPQYRIRGNPKASPGKIDAMIAYTANGVSPYADDQPTGDLPGYVERIVDPTNPQRYVWSMWLRKGQPDNWGNPRTEMGVQYGSSHADEQVGYEKPVYAIFDIYLDEENWAMTNDNSMIYQWHTRDDTSPADVQTRRTTNFQMEALGGGGVGGSTNPDPLKPMFHVTWDKLAASTSDSPTRDTNFFGHDRGKALVPGRWHTFVLENTLSWENAQDTKLWWDEETPGEMVLAASRHGLTACNDKYTCYAKSVGLDAFDWTGSYQGPTRHWYTHGAMIFSQAGCDNDPMTALAMFRAALTPPAQVRVGKQLTTGSGSLESAGPPTPGGAFSIVIDDLFRSDWSPDADTVIASQWEGSGHACWRLWILKSQKFELDISSDGTASRDRSMVQQKGCPQFENGKEVVKLWVSWDGLVAKFFRMHAGSTTWVQFGNSAPDTGSPFLPRADITAKLKIAGGCGIGRLRIFPGAGEPVEGTQIADCDIANYVSGSSFPSGGHTYTLVGNATVDDL